MKLHRLAFALIFSLLSRFPASFAAEDELSISQSQDQVAISWSRTAVNCVLEKSPDVSSPSSWLSIPPGSYQTNAVSQFVAIDTDTNSNHFFRLRRLNPSAVGLTALWDFDETQGEMSTGSGGAGVKLFLTNATWASGRLGSGAIRFNGDTSGASRAVATNQNSQLLPQSQGPFSLSFWFNPEALSPGASALIGIPGEGWQVLLENQGPGTNYLSFIGTGSGASLAVRGRTLLLPGQWRHLAVTYDGIEGALFLDSILLARGRGIVGNNNARLCVGGGFGGHASFFGRMDDIRVYTNHLAEEHISVSGHWRFDELGGSFCEDSSIYGQHGILQGDMLRTASRMGRGLELSSGNLIISNASYTVLPPSGNGFTISFWLCAKSLATNTKHLLSSGRTGLGGWWLNVESMGAGAAMRWHSTNGRGTLNLLAPVKQGTNVWDKFDLTYDGAIATIYQNGRPLKDQHGGIRGIEEPLIVGRHHDFEPFEGVIDDLKIYAHSKAASQIGPRAETQWETVMLNSTTNIILRGSGRFGKPLAYAISPLPVPTRGVVTMTSNSSSVIYTAGTNKGPDSFVYTVSDGEFTSEPAVVHVSVVQPHWLSVAGGTVSPRDGSSPMQAWAVPTADVLDAIWGTNNFYDCFFYSPGEYLTHGWKFLERSTANTGCKHIGAGSSGSSQTSLKLVDIWGAWTEEVIFAPLHAYVATDDFEVHDMLLNCNAQNLPKYLQGEPVSFQIPLRQRAPINTLTLKWASGAGSVSGSARELAVCTRSNSTDLYHTNHLLLSSTSSVHVITLNTQAQDIFLSFHRHDPSVDFYGLREIEVSGTSAEVSLPMATGPENLTNELNKKHSVLNILDGSPTSAWISDNENVAQIDIPVPPGTPISQLNIQWGCQTLPDGAQAGPAAAFMIQARDENGIYHELPFVRHSRSVSGWESNTFGTITSTNPFFSYGLRILLTQKEEDYYCIRELTLQNGLYPVNCLIPTASTSQGSPLLAFDRDMETEWASGTQGMVGAINVKGNNLKFTNLKVIGFGTKRGRECFPLGVSSAGDGGGNILVEDCILSDPATNNTDGLTAVFMLAFQPRTLTNAVIRRCSVRGVNSYFSYSHGFAASHVENSFVDDCGAGIYFEPNPDWGDNAGLVTIRSNIFQNVTFGLSVLSYPDAGLGDIRFLNNEVILNGNQGGGIFSCDTCLPGRSGRMKSLTVLNNLIRYSDWQTHPERANHGLYYSDIQHAIFGNNVLVLPSTTALRVRQCPAGSSPPAVPFSCGPGPLAGVSPCIDQLLPGYMRAWFNNRNLAGTLLDVRFSLNGLDRLASEQQWSE